VPEAIAGGRVGGSDPTRLVCCGGDSLRRKKKEERERQHPSEGELPHTNRGGGKRLLKCRRLLSSATRYSGEKNLKNIVGRSLSPNRGQASPLNHLPTLATGRVNTKRGTLARLTQPSSHSEWWSYSDEFKKKRRRPMLSRRRKNNSSRCPARVTSYRRKRPQDARPLRHNSVSKS